MVYKTLKNIELKAYETDGIMQVEAYASNFGNVDSGRDIVEKGAFTKTLNENKKRIKTLFNHDWNMIIGKPLEIFEDSKGLYTKTQFVKTFKSEEVYELVKQNIVNELSIGYDIVKSDYDRTNKINHLRELKLYEYSFVTFAMNDQAQVTDVKSIVKQLKAGRMLSDKNINSIKEVMDILKALLDNAGIEPSTTQETQYQEMGNNLDDEPKKSLNIDNIDLELLLYEIKNIKK